MSSLDELDELQKECNINEYGNIDENGHYIFKRFREILSDQVAKAKLEAFDVAFDCHDYDRLRAYRAKLLKGVK